MANTDYEALSRLVDELQRSGGRPSVATGFDINFFPMVDTDAAVIVEDTANYFYYTVAAPFSTFYVRIQFLSSVLVTPLGLRVSRNFSNAPYTGTRLESLYFPAANQGDRSSFVGVNLFSPDFNSQQVLEVGNSSFMPPEYLDSVALRNIYREQARRSGGAQFVASAGTIPSGMVSDGTALAAGNLDLIVVRWR